MKFLIGDEVIINLDHVATVERAPSGDALIVAMARPRGLKLRIEPLPEFSVDDLWESLAETIRSFQPRRHLDSLEGPTMAKDKKPHPDHPHHPHHHPYPPHPPHPDVPDEDDEDDDDDRIPLPEPEPTPAPEPGPMPEPPLPEPAPLPVEPVA